jgi:hypothetical protein
MIGCLDNRRPAPCSLACHIRHFPEFSCVQLKVLDLAYLVSAYLDPSIRKQTSNQVLMDSQFGGCGAHGWWGNERVGRGI